MLLLFYLTALHNNSLLASDKLVIKCVLRLVYRPFIIKGVSSEPLGKKKMLGLKAK